MPCNDKLNTGTDQSVMSWWSKIFEFRHTSSTRQKTNPLGEDFNYAEEFKN